MVWVDIKCGTVVARSLNKMNFILMRNRITAALETDRVLLQSGYNISSGGFSVPVCSPEDSYIYNSAKCDCMSLIRGTEDHQVTPGWPQAKQCPLKSVSLQAQFSTLSYSEILYPISALLPLLESFGEHFPSDVL